MNRLKLFLKSPALCLGLTPLLFALSQIIILGYNWIFEGYAGDLTITISRYVGFNLWTSILFAIFNITITTIMLYYYLSIRKNRSTLWFALSCIQAFSFLTLSFFPHNTFITSEAARTVVNNIHLISARTMFFVMFAIGIETLRLAHLNKLKFLQKLPLLRSKKHLSFPKPTTITCILFILYALFYLVTYLAKWEPAIQLTLIIESGYIYAFMALLIVTHKVKVKVT